ncbi:MAG: oxygenase MpaB family protein [Myxococcota bacterium]
MTRHLPHRVANLPQARERYGDLVDRFAPWFWRADPAGDAAVEALERDRAWWCVDRALADGIDAVPGAPDAMRALFDEVDRVPLWVDRERVARAGPILFRALAIGPIVLGARSLVAGYCSPAGNKPLVMTGRLGGSYQGTRLAETGRFISTVCTPEALERGGEGFALCVKVRLMHAKVRWLIREQGEWDVAAWGEPINQHDMVATSMLFSQVFLEGLRAFGLQITAEQGADWMHLWRWASVLLGTEASIVPTTEEEAARLVDLIRLTQEPPDADSRRLARAILDAPSQQGYAGGVALAEGFCRALIGDDLADGLELPRTPYRHAVKVASLVVGPVDRVRARSRRVDGWFVKLGARYWADAIDRSAKGEPLTFVPPAAIRSVIGRP